MGRPELVPHLERIDILSQEMQKHIPISLKGVSDFRADLAGLLVVTIVASYESCVKETLISYSFKQSSKFSEYVGRRYDKLNSKIAVNDLCRYCNDFEPSARTKFNNNRKKRKDRINNSLGQDIEKKYQQILDWRHDFAHKALRNTTIEEAIEFHRYAKHVLFAFYDSFNSP
ncbi:MAG: hypothetical protein H6858_04035 [Rhodospirillales bacterium]|nr:hypothetical protein [Alphaproteobacteria bacterium]MCB9976756.1 hypothetical protein [Rhodospirillales bacterium]